MWVVIDADVRGRRLADQLAERESTAPINILFVKYVRRHPRRVRQDEGRRESVDLYTLTNRNGLIAKITNLGGH